MKLIVLTLLVLNLMCFSLGDDKDQKSDFVDIDSADGDALPQVEDYVEDKEDPNFIDDLEDDDDDSQEEDGDDEPQDPDGFKDDEPDDLEDPVKDKLKEKDLRNRPVPAKPEVDPEVKQNPKPSETPGSGMEPSEDNDLKQALDDKLGLK